MELKDKVVLFTGTSSGVATAAVLDFAQKSAKLALVGLEEENLKKIAEDCERLNESVALLCITADVTVAADCERVVNKTVEHFGKIDVLVNSSDTIAMGGIKNSSMETYDKIMSTNMRAVYQMTMLATPHLVQSKGCIVNVSCIAGKKPTATTLAYSLSKAALDYFTRCLALELAPDGVRVNSVNPGLVEPQLLKDIGLEESQLESFIKGVTGDTLIKIPVELTEVVKTIGNLACDITKDTTGCVWDMEGEVQ